MTSYVHWLKVAQDKPVSVAHLRALDESAETILRYNKAAIFSQPFQVSGAVSVSTPFEGPMCYWPGEVPKYKLVVCYDVTGSPSKTTFTVELPDNGGFSEYEVSETPTTSGIQYSTFDIEPIGAFSNFDFKGFGRFKIEGDKPWLLFYYGIFAYYDDYESSIPYQGEIADSVHFSNIIAKIKKAYAHPHLISNWMGSYQIGRDGLSSSDTSFKTLHAYDYQDNRLSSSACQFTSYLIGSLPNGSAAATHFGYIAHNDSGNSISGNVSAVTQSGVGVLFNGAVSGISYLKTSGYSSVHVDMSSDASPRPHVRAMSIWAKQNDYQSGRVSDTSYNTLVSLSEYEGGDIITATMFNSAARALFNLGFHTAGPPIAVAHPEGCSLSNFASYTTSYIAPIYIRNHWLMGKRDRDYLKFHIGYIFENPSGTNKTQYLRFSTVTSGHTASTDFKVDAGTYTYQLEELEIKKDDKDADFLWLEIDSYQNSAVTPKMLLWSLYNAPLTTSYTP